MTKSRMQAPVININGTSADELLAQVINAMTAIRKAKQAIADAYPHGRDYQTVDPALHRQAMAEHKSRLQRLEDISNEMEDIGKQIIEQREKFKNGANNVGKRGESVSADVG